MARIKLPGAIAEWFVLFDNVKKRHDADAAASVLIAYFVEQGNDLDDFLSDRNNAEAAHVAFLLFEKNNEIETERRNNLFETVFEDHKKCVQFLKKLFYNSVHKLGEWHVTVDGSNRIVYSHHFAESAFDIGKFIDKHDSYAAGTSPLQPFLDENNIDLAQNLTKLTEAKTAHANFQTNNANKEMKREERDVLFDPIKKFLRGIGSFLVALYPDLPHKAGNWGFEIDSSPKADRIRSFKLSAGEIRTVQNVKIRSKLKNTGSVQLLIRPGNDVSATPIPLDSNKEFLIVRKFGKIIVENPSGSSNGSFEATIII